MVTVLSVLLCGGNHSNVMSKHIAVLPILIATEYCNSSANYLNHAPQSGSDVHKLTLLYLVDGDSV